MDGGEGSEVGREEGKGGQGASGGQRRVGRGREG